MDFNRLVKLNSKYCDPLGSSPKRSINEPNGRKISAVRHEELIEMSRKKFNLRRLEKDREKGKEEGDVYSINGQVRTDSASPEFADSVDRIRAKKNRLPEDTNPLNCPQRDELGCKVKPFKRTTNRCKNCSLR